MGQLFEVLMLITFGISFPVSIYKGIKSRSTKGKSLLFVILISMAYFLGIMSKLVVHNYDYGLLFHCINFTLSLIDMTVFCINRYREGKNNEPKSW